MANHGVYVSEQATSVSTPVVADSGVPFVVGAAPVQSAASPAAAGVPVLCTSWAEAVEKLGYSEDWGSYPLCEFMYSHFQLFGCQPVIMCNVLDVADMKEAVAASDVALTDHKAKLPIAAIDDENLVVKPAGGAGEAYVKDTDYSTYYDGEFLVIEVLSPSQDTANTVCALCRSAILHMGFDGRRANSGNLAFLYTPAEFPAPPVTRIVKYRERLHP